jgi:PrtD family type I secretion system ABC transporter
MGIQILTIALSAYLIVNGKLHGGLLFANMILAARALAPIERVVGSWTVLVNAGQSYGRLKRILQDYEPPAPATTLPRPKGHLLVERLSFMAPNSDRLVLNNVHLEVRPGETLGVVGASGAGKSTLIRLLVGVWKPLGNGFVRLDGSDVYTWDRAVFGRYVGYLPQDVELFAGTVRDNIARFRADATDEQVIEAANAAGAHELIVRLPKGYDTEVGEGGAVLSGGQRQRIGLARALFAEPALVVLDEPNANLDVEGEEALMNALETLKARGASVVIASHKPTIFRTSDTMLVLKEGKVEAFGPRNEIIARLVRPAAQPQTEARTA